MGGGNDIIIIIIIIIKAVKCEGVNLTEVHDGTR
jgi:hypothetical protein